MSDWEDLALGEFLSFSNGKKRPDATGLIPVFGGNGIYASANSANAEKDTIVIGRVGAYCGSIFFSNSPCWVSDNAISCRANVGVSAIWAHYMLKVYDLGHYATGAAQPMLTQSILKSLSVKVPSEPEQEAIAEVLSSLDDKIDLLKRQNKTLEGMAEALFRQWFIEEARDDWPVLELRDVFEEIESGRRPKGGVGKYTEGVPSIGAESVKKIGVHEFGKEKFVPQEFFDSMKKGVVQHHDILVYKDGGVPGEFKPHFTMVGFGFPHAKMCINEHVFRCRPKRPTLRSFSFCYLNSRRCRFELEERGTGAAIPGLNSTEFSTCPIPLPNEELLEKFESLAGDWFDRILKNALESRALEKLRDTLLPKLMSGEVRVQMD